MRQGLVLAISMLCVGSAMATTIQLGKPLPSVNITDQGEVVLNGQETTFKPWSTEELPGKVHIVQHFAARSSAKALNEPLIAAIKAEHFDPAVYQTVTLVNLDDAIFGTGSFARHKTVEGKKDSPNSQVVIDNEGLIRKAWDLAPESAATVVLDKNGNVQFVKDGQLTPSEVKQIIDQVKEDLGMKTTSQP